MKMFYENFLNQWIKPFLPEKTFNILSFLIVNMDKENCVFATAEIIAKNCDTTLLTAQKILKGLMTSGGITKIRNGVYQINTDCIFKGSHNQRVKAKEKFSKPFKKLANKPLEV